MMDILAVFGFIVGLAALISIWWDTNDYSEKLRQWRKNP